MNTVVTHKCFKLMAFCILFMPASLFASDELGDLINLSMDDLLQVKITGSTLTPENIKTVPSAVTVFTHQQIMRTGVDYLHELLNFIPSYQSQRSSENSMVYSYSSRGRRLADKTKEILLLIDGRNMNDPRTGSTDAILRMLPIEMIERVEVIRGPGSAIYGSNAFTGVINIISRQGVNEAGLSTGSNDRYKGHAFLSQQQDDWQLDMFVHAEGDNGDHFNAQDTYSANRINTTDPRQFAYFDMALRHQDTLLRALLYDSSGDDFFVLGALSNGFNKDKTDVEQISLEQDIHWQADLRSHLYFGYMAGEFDFNTQIAAPGAFAAFSSPSSNDPPKGIGIEKRTGYLFKWHNDWHISSVSNHQFGLEWRRESETKAKVKTNFDIAALSARNFPITSTAGLDQVIAFGTEASRNIFGLYEQYQYTWAERTHLTLGARYDHYTKVGSRVSPRVGVVHQLNDVNTLKVLYGEAFRAPALNETGLINNPVIVGNPDLKHEVAKTWDLIWLGSWTSTYLSVGWFHTRYVSPIIRGQIGSVSTFINGDDETSQGFELETRHQLTDEWALNSSLSRITSKPSSGLREADTTGSIILNWQSAGWNWNIDAVYTGDRQILTPGNTKLTLDQHWLLDTKLRYDSGQKWEVFAQTKNLLNKQYATATEGNTITEGLPNRGREWLFGVEYDF